MVRSSHDRGPHSHLKGHVERLERLATDLRMLADGHAPLEDCLHSAPLLDPYTVTAADVFCLEGWVDSHPILGGPKLIVTSPIWYMADDFSWARTYSRFYRLGSPRRDGITTH